MTLVRRLSLMALSVVFFIAFMAIMERVAEAEAKFGGFAQEAWPAAVMACVALLMAFGSMLWSIRN